MSDEKFTSHEISKEESLARDDASEAKIIPFPIERRREKEAKKAEDLKKSSLLFSFGPPVAAIAVTLLGLLTSYHFSKKSESTSERTADGRRVASQMTFSPGDVKEKIKQERKLIEEIHRQKNLREVASLGTHPRLVDQFQLELLKGRYEVVVSDGHIQSLRLRNGEEPIAEPDHDLLFKKFGRVWQPSVTEWKVSQTSIEDQKKLRETVELFGDGDQKRILVIKKDLLGRLLEITRAQGDRPPHD